MTIQFQIIVEKLYSAFYTLDDAPRQMKSYVFDTVRSTVSTMTLDEIYESKDAISIAVKFHLREAFHVYGYSIHQALLTNVKPAQHVQDAMNEINTERRLRFAAVETAEGL